MGCGSLYSGAVRQADHPIQANDTGFTAPANRGLVNPLPAKTPGPRQPVFELCAETIEACVAARDGGASRIEFCSALDQEGLTPSLPTLEEAIRRSELPVHMLLRPRAGDFVYTDAEFAAMRESLRQGLALGATGFALGLLQRNGRVDVERTRALVADANGHEVTFHRAFDVSASLEAALEDVVLTGCQRVLTSGGASDVVVGTPTLAGLVRRAAARVEIAVGGGLRIGNARTVAARTGATHFHGSLRQVEDGPDTGASPAGKHRGDAGMVTGEAVRSMIRQLGEGMRQSTETLPPR